MSRYRPRFEYGLLLVAAGCFVGTAVLLTDRTTVAVLAAGLVVGGLVLVFWDHLVRARAVLTDGSGSSAAEQRGQRQDDSRQERRRPAA